MTDDEYRDIFLQEKPKERKPAEPKRVRRRDADGGMVAKKKRKHDEDDLQMRCVAWWNRNYHDVAPLLHHSPNEGWLRGGVIEGVRRKLMGVRAGFPDLILLVPTNTYHFMAVELKAKTGRQSDTQKAYQRLVEAHGGLYVVARSVDEFIAFIKAYLEDI